MKRLTAKQRLHLLRRAAAELTSRRRRRARGPGFAGMKPLIVRFVGDLDLVDNGERTRQQFYQLERVPSFVRAGRVRKLRVELDQVTSIEACALLYLAALVDRVGRETGLRVHGNYPAAPAARKAMVDAKFHEFMGMRLSKAARKAAMQAPRGLHLMRGSSSRQLDPTYWTPLPRYLRVHGGLSEEDADAFYNAFGECVENVRHHAYGKGGGLWYGVAIRPSADKPARAVVLDLGVGIPRTIRRTPGDRFRATLAVIADAVNKALAMANFDAEDEDDEVDEAADAWLRRAASDDWMCIFLATLGLRTQTAQAGRGTGLKWLRETVLERRQGALHVLSGEACVTWRYDERPNASKLTPLLGTVVCLEIGGEPAWRGEDDA